MLGFQDIKAHRSQKFSSTNTHCRLRLSDHNTLIYDIQATLKNCVLENQESNNIYGALFVL